MIWKDIFAYQINRNQTVPNSMLLLYIIAAFSVILWVSHLEASLMYLYQ